MTTSAPPRPGRLVAVAVLVALASAGGFAAWWATRAPAPDPESAPDLARDAEEYLKARGAVPLSAGLAEVLAAPAPAVPTDRHPLLNQPAPPFALVGADDARVELEPLLARGPVVLVFYYGYSCDHCVAQLFGINKDLRHFTELNATVVAVSPDTPVHTRARYAEYGKFGFPVLSDPARAVAIKYGVFRPAAGDLPKWQAHGTFVIARDRTVRWANTGPEPFTDTVTLLRELAAAEGRLPAPPAKGGTP